MLLIILIVQISFASAVARKGHISSESIAVLDDLQDSYWVSQREHWLIPGSVGINSYKRQAKIHGDFLCLVDGGRVRADFIVERNQVFLFLNNRTDNEGGGFLKSLVPHAAIKDGIMRMSTGNMWYRSPYWFIVVLHFLSVTNGVYVLCILCVLEYYSYDVVRKALRDQKGYADLYKAGWKANALNLLILGPAAMSLFGVAGDHVHTCTEQVRDSSMWYQFYWLVIILVFQAIWYYLMHRLMHVRQFYWIHAFHHRFGVNGCPVTPVAAFAVHPLEFLFAYIIPLIYTKLFVFQVGGETRFCATMAIAMFNFLIHTPLLSTNQGKRLPSWFVSEYTHGLHHTTSPQLHFAAPIFNLDLLVDFLSGKFKAQRQHPRVTKLGTTESKRKSSDSSHEDANCKQNRGRQAEEDVNCKQNSGRQAEEARDAIPRKRDSTPVPKQVLQSEQE